MFPLCTRIHCIYTLEGTFVILPISSILGHETLFLLFPFTPPFSLRLASQTTAKNRQSGHQPLKYSICINKYIEIFFLTVVLFLKCWYHNYSLKQNSVSVVYIRCGHMQEPLNTLNHNPALSPAWALILPNQSYTLSPSPSQDKGPCSSALSQAGRWLQAGSRKEGRREKTEGCENGQFGLVIKYQHTSSTKRQAGTWNRAGSVWAQAWL